MGNLERYRPAVDDGDDLRVPTELRGVFDQIPLLRHEDPKSYWSLLGRFARDIKPSDVIEWLWLKDVLDQTWELVRLRRIKAALLDAGRRAAVVEIFAPVGQATDHDVRYYDTWDKARERADEWCEAKTKPKIETRLNKQGLDADSITAVSFSMQAMPMEAAERMVAALEFRRNVALREIEDRRQRLGRLLRQASDKAINGAASTDGSSMERVQRARAS